MTNCQCPVAGYCARHQVNKTQHLRNLCQNSDKYFYAWESGHGPGQIKKSEEERLEAADNRARFVKKCRNLWRQLFANVHTSQDLAEWEKNVPSFGCKCRRFYCCWKKDNPPETIDFDWKWRLKSAVNKKLAKDNLDLYEAQVVLDEHADFGNRTRSDIVAVTALSPKLHSLEKQIKTVESWKKFGLNVFARNTAWEIEYLRPHFPGVNWIVDERLCEGYAYPTQKILNLASTAIELNTPVLVINSDCELRGKNELLAFNESEVFLGLRWNYDPGEPDIVSEFRWGIDAFSCTPRQAALIPANFPYGIGHAIWDYAIPEVMRQSGIALKFVHKPMIFHENHHQNWSNDDWFRGQRWMLDNLGAFVEYASSNFRDSLDPSWRYSETRWVRKSASEASIESVG